MATAWLSALSKACPAVKMPEPLLVQIWLSPLELATTASRSESPSSLPRETPRLFRLPSICPLLLKTPEPLFSQTALKSELATKASGPFTPSRSPIATAWLFALPRACPLSIKKPLWRAAGAGRFEPLRACDVHRIPRTARLNAVAARMDTILGIRFICAPLGGLFI